MTNPIQEVNEEELHGHNIQSLIETIYIRAGNEVLGGALASLESALGVTKQTLDALNLIQNLHNQISVASKDSEAFKAFLSGEGDFDIEDLDGYEEFTSTFFGDPIVPTPNDPTPEMATRLGEARDILTSGLDQLLAQNPEAAEDPNSLYARAKAVFDELPPSTSGEEWSNWLLDNYQVQGTTGSEQAGQIQQRITFALTAGQSLNDTQKENVRRYLFVFEEYNKSAGAVLTKLNQLMERMAQNIAR